MEFVPLWKTHTTESVDFPVASLLPQILGAVFIMIILLIYPVVSQGKLLIQQLGLSVPFVFSFLSNPTYLLFLSLIFSILVTYGILKRGKNMEVTTFHDLLAVYRELNLVGHRPILLDILFGISLGMFTGVFYSLILFVPSYIIGVFFFFFFIPFLPLELSVILSFSTAILFAVTSVLFFKGKITLAKVSRTKFKDYPKTRRVIEIENSNLPPIVCQGCRSFISAVSKECPVCYDPIDV